jgi:hypothetical protein
MSLDLLSREDQRVLDNAPCPRCAGDRLRTDFTGSGRCHAERPAEPTGAGDWARGVAAAYDDYANTRFPDSRDARVRLHRTAEAWRTAALRYDEEGAPEPTTELAVGQVWQSDRDGLSIRLRRRLDPLGWWYDILDPGHIRNGGEMFTAIILERMTLRHIPTEPSC